MAAGWRRPDTFSPSQGWKALVASRGLRLVAESWLGSWWERLVHHPVLLVLDKVGRQ